MFDTVQISLDLICTVKKDGAKRWVAHCPALDVASQGKTREDAKRCLEEAIELWVESCLERGTLEAALREVGFERVHADSLRPGAQHVSVQAVDPAAEIAADTFPVHLSIPAYQAAALLSAQG